MRLDTVGKRYGLRQPWIVRGVSLEVAAGKLIRVEGRNGSGKSTLLRVVAGVTVPSAGKVVGRPPTGYVPERFPAALPFSGREYLLHMGRVHGLRGSLLTSRVDEVLDQLGAAEYAGSPMRSLSKGMCQKMAIAQALLPAPDLLVLDEAWTGLDVAARGALDGAVAQRLAGGGSVLFVDHEQQRLAGLVAERWQVAGGVVAVAAAAAAGAGRDDEPAATGECVLIAVTGLADDSARWVSGLPGVLSAAPAAGQRLELVAAAGESDGILRAVLAAGGHVASVAAPGLGSTPAPADGGQPS
jgi:ABC-2 type transport system ATP-binding protein